LPYDLSVGPWKLMTVVVDGFDGLIDHPDGATAPRPSIQSTLAASAGPKRNRVAMTVISILAFIVLPLP
jgi:hypothetical protein